MSKDKASKPVLTFEDVLEAVEVLQKLSKMELPFKTAYRISKIIRKVNSEQKFFQEKRMELFKKYGTEDDKKQYTVKPENIETFTKEMKDILSSTCEIEFQPIDAEMITELKLTPQDLIGLEKLVSGKLE